MDEKSKDRDEYYMGLALIEARRAFSEGEIPVGAVVIDGAGGIIAAARNEKERLHDPTAHAELTAIRMAAARSAEGWRLSGMTLYVTKEPCVMCAGGIVNARISRVVYGCADVKGGAAGSLFTLLTDERLNHRAEVTTGVREEDCAGLLREFFAELRRGCRAV
ncbi:tRNA adenosine(34) deaminase TadA [Candidatus Magnetominusculus dajiuhuensis]|uniref:tRNA adenosine(34) deaminase TadA n=1 Tax=Candidatus Magnetominusculus dajiuhuensis TaxID=3137712 RepID=UPI003B436EDF